MRTAAPRVKSAAVQRFGWCPGGWSRTVWVFSAGSDGEGVEVVGQDAPGGPRSRSIVAFEAAPAEAVAAFEVADAAFDADSEAREASVGASGAGRLAAGDEDAVGQVFGDAGREEAAVEREFARSELETLELGNKSVRGRRGGCSRRAQRPVQQRSSGWNSWTA